MSVAISYNKYTIYVIIDNVLKKITTEMSKKNSFCCILYCKARKGCLKTEIYVLSHRLKKNVSQMYILWFLRKKSKAFKNQAAVAQSMGSAIHWVNLFPVDNAIGLIFLVA